MILNSLTSCELIKEVCLSSNPTDLEVVLATKLEEEININQEVFQSLEDIIDTKL